MKPLAPACDRNKDAILTILRDTFAGCRTVLEIGSGTGQHAVWFARHLDHLVWRTSDLVENHDGVRAWLEEAQLSNLEPPVELDVCTRPWPVERSDAVFSANTAHIMSWPQVRCMFVGVSGVLDVGGVFCQYGPFKYGGRHTSASNEEFDASLRGRSAVMGIRDVDDLRALGADTSLELVADHAMPANNRTLVWRRQ